MIAFFIIGTYNIYRKNNSDFPRLTIIFSEVIIINIEINNPNRLKEFFHKLNSRLEDMMFSVIQKLPERLIPQFVMNCLDRYTTKRINQLKQEQVKNTWKNMYLQKAIDEINNRK